MNDFVPSNVVQIKSKNYSESEESDIEPNDPLTIYKKLKEMKQKVLSESIETDNG